MISIYYICNMEEMNLYIIAATPTSAALKMLNETKFNELKSYLWP